MRICWSSCTPSMWPVVQCQRQRYAFLHKIRHRSFAHHHRYEMRSVHHSLRLPMVQAKIRRLIAIILIRQEVRHPTQVRCAIDAVRETSISDSSTILKRYRRMKTRYALTHATSMHGMVRVQHCTIRATIARHWRHTNAPLKSTRTMPLYG